MVARSRARYLAPVALAAAVAATAFVVGNGVHSSRATSAPAQTPATSSIRPARHRRRSAARFYLVRAGDSFSTISARTGVPIGTLESLNPGVSPTTLQTGQRLRLR